MLWTKKFLLIFKFIFTAISNVIKQKPILHFRWAIFKQIEKQRNKFIAWLKRNSVIEKSRWFISQTFIHNLYREPSPSFALFIKIWFDCPQICTRFVINGQSLANKQSYISLTTPLKLTFANILKKLKILFFIFIKVINNDTHTH